MRRVMFAIFRFYVVLISMQYIAFKRDCLDIEVKCANYLRVNVNDDKSCCMKIIYSAVFV